MTITVYELGGLGDIRFSPFCWRTLLALKHKGLDDVECIPVYFRDRSPIAFSNQDRVPVIVDGDRWVNDSWDIACYLEETYPHRPSLFGSDMGRAEALFINAWTQQIQNPGLINIILWDAFQAVDPADHDWWREDREKRYGELESYKDGKEEKDHRLAPEPEAAAGDTCRTTISRRGRAGIRRLHRLRDFSIRPVCRPTRTDRVRRSN